MTLSKESADAFRQCLRILAPRCTPEERRVQSRNVESYIAEGKWIPALLIEDIALLFYPNDSSLESAMLIKMKAAIETQELISTPMKKDVLMASDLAAWPDCPPVPLDSSLRYWLPDWMHATPLPVMAGNEPVKQVNAMKKSALVAALEYEWPSIVNDIREATRNGLKAAAHTGKHGQWDKDKARAWAVSNGKITQSAPGHSLAGAWPGTTTRHKITG